MRFLVIAWITVVAAGLALLWNYEWRPGARTSGAEAWPAHTSVTPRSGVFNLVVCLHPKCPCSSATVDELYKIVKRARTPVHVNVLLFESADAAQDWATSSPSEAVRTFPDTSVVPDPEGLQASLFGALTSGDVQLYSPVGRRLFHGGITISRGHAGDNAGANAISGFLNGERSANVETPVFGCVIRSPRTDEDAK